MGDNQKPRVLIFSLAYLPFVGGAEIAVKEITDRLSERFSFDLITYQFNRLWPEFEKVGPVNVYRVNSWSKFSYIFKAWKLALKLQEKNKYSAVWSIMAAYAGGAALLFKLSNPKVPFLLTLQEGDSEKHILKRVGIFYPLWKLIFKKADYIQAISQYLADFGGRHGANCPIQVIPNGVDLSKFKPRSVSREEDSKIIITPSRLVKKNGIDILVRALAELKKLSAANYQLQILGDGPEGESLKKLVKNLGVQNLVLFMGHVDPDRIPDYLSQADIFVRPSRSEGLGNSFLEAMAAGLPVIATPVGGIPEFIKDGETGLFCRVDDPQDLANKIVILASDKSMQSKLAENGQKLVETNYSWDNISRSMALIFKKLCGYL